MPYVITTKQYADHAPAPIRDEHGGPIQGPQAPEILNESRRAVATLDDERTPDGTHIAPYIGREGGTIGPLPDGTVIEVEPVDRLSFPERAYENGGWSMKPAEILDAYNAAHNAAQGVKA